MLDWYTPTLHCVPRCCWWSSRSYTFGECVFSVMCTHKLISCSQVCARVHMLQSQWCFCSVLAIGLSSLAQASLLRGALEGALFSAGQTRRP